MRRMTSEGMTPERAVSPKVLGIRNSVPIGVLVNCKFYFLSKGTINFIILLPLLN